MTINVTQEDIDQGKRGDCRFCPVALAVIRATGERDIYADGSNVWIHKHNHNSRAIPTPDEATDFMDYFDSGEPVAPFSFELEVP